ncbi:hypothetical protein KKG82_01005 [Patescibacteria group bacterium]|nr:hypothetical protein [Patescibacteria group bacterium]
MIVLVMFILVGCGSHQIQRELPKEPMTFLVSGDNSVEMHFQGRVFHLTAQKIDETALSRCEEHCSPKEKIRYIRNQGYIHYSEAKGAVHLNNTLSSVRLGMVRTDPKYILFDLSIMTQTVQGRIPSLIHDSITVPDEEFKGRVVFHMYEGQLNISD